MTNRQKDRMTAAEFRRYYLKEQPAEERPAGNRKVRGATKTERDGVKFDSKVESYMHSLLTMYKIRFEFQKQYTLQSAFEYDGRKIQPITYTVDFLLPDHDVIIDTKGVQTQQGALRIKMLKKRFAEAGLRTRIELPKDNAECATLIRKLLENDKK